MPHWHNQPWQRNLSTTASGKTGAVQADAFSVNLFSKQLDLYASHGLHRSAERFHTSVRSDRVLNLFRHAIGIPQGGPGQT